MLRICFKTSVTKECTCGAGANPAAACAPEKLASQTGINKESAIYKTATAALDGIERNISTGEPSSSSAFPFSSRSSVLRLSLGPSGNTRIRLEGLRKITHTNLDKYTHSLKVYQRLKRYGKNGETIFWALDAISPAVSGPWYSKDIDALPVFSKYSNLSA